MFLRLVVGGVTDPDALERQLGHWIDGVAAGAAGWLGSTGGMTADGRAVMVSRFVGRQSAATAVSEEAAAGECLVHPLSVSETDDVTVVDAGGDQAGAGFVQLMRATVADRERFEALEAEIGPAFAEFRPDFLAGYRAWFPDGTMAALDYFRSESEARAGEAREMPATLREGFSQWLSLVQGAEWYDLLRPRIAFPS